MPSDTTPDSRPLTRGELGRQCAVNGETVRYYEKIGLLREPGRSAGGHRLYERGDVERLTFIRRSRELGFSLDEIRGLLDLVDGGDYTCAEVLERTRVHLDDVTQKILDLRKMQSTLRRMVARCDGGEVPDCPIVDALQARP